MRFWKRNKVENDNADNADDAENAENAKVEQDDVMNQEPEQAAVEKDSAEAPSEMSEAMQIRDRIVKVIKTVYDPEIPVDIYELGLVYGIEVTDDGEAHVTMTLTSPMCPVAETLPPEVEDKVRNVVGVKDVSLDLVWDPPWTVDMMSDAARLDLNMM